MKKRIFLSILISEEIKNVLYEYGSQFEGKEIRWVKKENLHLTVYFLGVIAEEKISGLIKNLEEIFSQIKPFTLKFESMAFAPSDDNIRMIWAKFVSNEYYKFLINKVASSLYEHDKVERREPVPHITVARIKDINFGKFVRNLPKLVVPDVDVIKCQLIESQLSEEGSIYRVIRQFLFT